MIALVGALRTVPQDFSFLRQSLSAARARFSQRWLCANRFEVCFSTPNGSTLEIQTLTSNAPTEYLHLETTNHQVWRCFAGFLTKTAERKWRAKGHVLLSELIDAMRFKDGLLEGETRIAA